jgi:hypothetical protein
MDTQLIPFARSIAGLTVLALFAVAIVAGQAEANLQGFARSDAPIEHISRIDDLDKLREIQGLRHALDTFFDLSGRVELRLNLLAEPRSNNDNVELLLHD